MPPLVTPSAESLRTARCVVGRHVGRCERSPTRTRSIGERSPHPCRARGRPPRRDRCRTRRARGTARWPALLPRRCVEHARRLRRRRRNPRTPATPPWRHPPARGWRPASPEQRACDRARHARCPASRSPPDATDCSTPPGTAVDDARSDAVAKRGCARSTAFSRSSRSDRRRSPTSRPSTTTPPRSPGWNSLVNSVGRGRLQTLQSARRQMLIVEDHDEHARRSLSDSRSRAPGSKRSRPTVSPRPHAILPRRQESRGTSADHRSASWSCR